MSHDIEIFDDGSAAYVGARQDAWHRLGTTVPHGLSPDEVLDLAHLRGWNVRKNPLTTEVVVDEFAFTVDIPDKFAVVRTNPVTGLPDALGVVGEYYTPMQNEAHVEFLQGLVDGGAQLETAGSLSGGRKVFVTAKMPEGMLIGGVDRHDLYIAAINSHDGSSAFHTIVTPVRVVCANTLAAALRDHQSEYKVKHCKSAPAVLAVAREALDLSWAYAQEFETEAERMLNTPMSGAEFDAALGTVFGDLDPGKPETRKIQKFDVIRGLLAAPTQANIAGTRWAGYNAITEYVDHFASVQRVDDAEIGRATRAITTGMDLKAKAFAALKV